jgi:hypothetical protein
MRDIHTLVRIRGIDMGGRLKYYADAQCTRGCALAEHERDHALFRGGTGGMGEAWGEAV